MTKLQDSVQRNGLPGSDALLLLAHGSPLGRTLDAAATLVTNIQENVGCAILLLTDYTLSVQATNGLQDHDEKLLSSLCQLPYDDCLASIQQQDHAEVYRLVTSSAEVIGALVVFDLVKSSRDAAIDARLFEVCAIATLAIEGKHLMDELYFVAHHDALTQTRNRVWLESELANVVDQAAEAGFSTGLILIGIDSFRIMNELLGAQLGNAILRAIAFRLSKALRPNWSLARCNGDEFIVLLRELISPDQIKAYASEVLNTLCDPFEFGDHELIIRATIGTCFSQPGECPSEELLNRAELALRHGKHCARGRVTQFERSMMSTPPERLEMERHLRFALRKREFELFYQPQIQLSTGKFLGVEALLRWRHPSLGFISPAIFVPIAEQIGIIDEIGTWVLEEAIRQLELWHRSGLQHLRVAVNVSAVQFSREDFASDVARLLRRADIDPSDVELEITESAVMTNLQHGAAQMKLLRSLGVRIALDDFGTGHSSLAYLQKLPVQRIKIDRMFIKDVAGDTAAHPLLSAIIRMGRALGFDLIAEGIETPEQAEVIAALGCDEVQGFFFSRPMPACEILAWAQKAESHNGPFLVGGTNSGHLRRLSA